MAEKQQRDFEIDLAQSLLRNSEDNVGAGDVSTNDDALTQLVEGYRLWNVIESDSLDSIICVSESDQEWTAIEGEFLQDI